MSRFDAAAAKAGSKAPVAKAAAPVAAKAKAKVGAKAAVKLITLEDKKIYVKKQDLKIADKLTDIEDEPNAGKKKELKTELKNLETDETYLRVKDEIKEAAAQAVRDAERAALTAKARADSGNIKDDASAEKGAKKPAGEQADEATMMQIDAAFAGSGKDAAAAKATAVARLETMASCTPFVLPRLEKLVSFFADSKLGAPSIKAACVIVKSILPEGHGVASTVVPVLLAGMDSKQWKTKAGCIEVLLPALQQMEHDTPAALASALPLIVPKLAEAALEVRNEVRAATKLVLQEIGTLVASPEIQKLSQDLVTALAEPTNQKHTCDVLARMGNQTFLSLIDAASLSLLMPVVIRGLKDRDAISKKWSAQIFGSTAILVKDINDLEPYVKVVVPLLRLALYDPVPEVVREVSKAFGTLEQVLPEYSREVNQPWLFERLRNGEIGEQIAASLAMAEVFVKMDKTRSSELIPEIEAGAMCDKPAMLRGFMELMDAMPNAMKMDFVPFIEKFFPRMLMGITGDKDQGEDAGWRASLSLVQRFGDLCPELLLSAFEAIYVANLSSTSAGEASRQQIYREKNAQLLAKVADKILEHKKFGQDLLTTEDCSTKETRELLLCLVFVMRSDQDAGVKRVANLAWKTVGGAPKLQKAIMPTLEKMLLKWRTGEMGCGAQKMAINSIEELAKSGDLEAPTDEVTVVEKRYAFPVPEGRLDGDAARIVAGEAPLEFSTKFERQESEAVDTMQCLSGSHASFAALPGDVISFCSVVARSVIHEGKRSKLGGKTIAANLAATLKAALGDAGDSFEAELPGMSEELARHALGDKFELEGAGDGQCENTLLRVENLLLMYGAGHLLLKDTTLEMKKNCRYGVVGQNGAGKTTLMKEIVDHRIVGMPKDLKCVHVDDSKLGLMSKSCLSCLEYVIKMAKEIDVHDAGRDTLTAVGFDEKMLEVPVSDLSTGWRMRLTLAVSMLKYADLVMLDEPTNHLDEQSVEWLAKYINSIDKSSVMVISHEPKFLNKICTHIVAYVDKKLEYTEGSFDAFAAAKGLSQEQIGQMLSGNLSFDTAIGDADAEGGEGGAAAKVAAPVMGPPKLSFPIPGSMEGVKSGTRAVLEAKKASFRYAKDKEYLIEECALKVSLNSRVAICGRNGCGKSTLMTMLCSEMSPSENKDGSLGSVERHCNLRMAYMKQDHLKALGPFFDTSPFIYVTTRFKDGYDGDLQKRLIEPEDQDEADRRRALGKEHGKYGNEVGTLIARSKVGANLMYEIQWAGLDDPKQNTLMPLSKLKEMGLDKVVIACDERIAAKAAGLDQRPLTRREVVRHCEAFGIDEEMCCNRQIRGFSAGQKVRLSLAAMFWTKPHVIAVDEPTNYLDVETVEALAKALTNFRGGIVMIEPKTDFVEKICNEKWWVEDGKITQEKLNNNVKRAA